MKPRCLVCFQPFLKPSFNHPQRHKFKNKHSQFTVPLCLQSLTPPPLDAPSPSSQCTTADTETEVSSVENPKLSKVLCQNKSCMLRLLLGLFFYPVGSTFSFHSTSVLKKIMFNDKVNETTLYCLNRDILEHFLTRCGKCF